MPSRNLLIATLMVGAAIALLFLRSGLEDSTTGSGYDDSQTGVVESLFERQISSQFVGFEGQTLRLLADDNVGSRHQRFIVELESGHTVLVSHNIDLAPRVPLDRGDRVNVRGEYEWNEQGGVVHWTHHDPDGRIQGGWIEHNGIQYR